MDKVVDNLMIFEGQGAITFFAGNYTEYCNHLYDKEQNSAKELKELKELENSKQKAEHKNKEAQKKKLSYKEQKEFQQLELEIEQLEAKKIEIENQMNSGSLSPEEIAESSETYQNTINKIDEKSFRWLELSEKAE